MKMIATGEFAVNLAPFASFVEGKDGVQLGRMSLTKTFSGDLAGRSLGEMLSAGTSVEGSAGYVALEQVEGMLHGKSGTFVLQHYGIMNRGEGRLDVEVVPDSGTGQLKGLTGKMNITIKDGKHLYEFEYTLP